MNKIGLQRCALLSIFSSRASTSPTPEISFMYTMIMMIFSCHFYTVSALSMMIRRIVSTVSRYVNIYSYLGDRIIRSHSGLHSRFNDMWLLLWKVKKARRDCYNCCLLFSYSSKPVKLYLIYYRVSSRNSSKDFKE